MTKEIKKTPIAQIAVTAVVIFAAAAGGMYLGGMLSQGGSDQASAEMDVFSSLTLKPGVDFPSIILEDRHLVAHKSRTLLDGAGTVVLFVENGCQPCQTMASMWSEIVEQGMIDSEQIIGITYSDAEQMEEQMADYGLNIRVYEDHNMRFMSDYGVDAFPLYLIVDRHGVIRFSDWDLSNEIKESRLKELINM